MEYGFFSLLVLRETFNATTRLIGILGRSRPHAGFPLLRLFLDCLERVSEDAHPETLAPAISELLDRFEIRCPGVIDALLRYRDRALVRDRDRLGPAPEAAEGGG